MTDKPKEGTKPYQNVRALVADANPNIRNSIRTPLISAGFEVPESASDVGKLREALSGTDVDLLICDLQLPGEGLYEVVRDIRHGKLGHEPYMVIIGTSAQSGETVVRRAINAGIDDVLLKPLTVSRLLDRIEHIARNRKPFVVTPTYVGPDRRHGDRRPQSKAEAAVMYEAPNPLSQGGASREAIARLREAISHTARIPWEDRLRSVMLRLLGTMEDIVEDLAHHGRTDANADLLRQLVGQIQALQDAVTDQDQDTIRKASEAIATAIDELSRETDPGHADEIRLLAHLTSAIQPVLSHRRGTTGAETPTNDDAG